MRTGPRSKVSRSAGARNVRPAASILAGGINGRAMEQAQREVAEEAKKREVSPLCRCAPSEECRCWRTPPRQADGLSARDLRILTHLISGTGAALVGVWPADLFALEAAGWSEDEAQRARSTGAAWFAEVQPADRAPRLYALTSSGWKEIL